MVRFVTYVLHLLRLALGHASDVCHVRLLIGNAEQQVLLLVQVLTGTGSIAGLQRPTVNSR